MAKIILINGPNLNLLGLREPETYGYASLKEVEGECRALASTFGHTLISFQSNHEGEIIDTIHQARGEAKAMIINAGAYSHSSIAIMDALNAFEGLVIEVHISNLYKREEFRHHSHIATRADGVIVGCGVHGYQLAVRHIDTLLKKPS